SIKIDSSHTLRRGMLRTTPAAGQPMVLSAKATPTTRGTTCGTTPGGSGAELTLATSLRFFRNLVPGSTEPNPQKTKTDCGKFVDQLMDYLDSTALKSN